MNGDKNPRKPSIFGHGGSIRNRIAVTFVFRLTTRILSLLTSIVLARLLGAEQYGVYAYIISLITLLGIPGALGLPQFCLRQVAAYQVHSSWSKLRGVLGWTNKVILFVSLMLIGCSGLVAWASSAKYDAATLATFGLGLVLLPLRALSALRSAALRGLGHVLIAQFPEALLRPGLFLILLLCSYTIFERPFHASAVAMGLQVFATAISFSVGAMLLWKRLPLPVKQHRSVTESGPWLRSAITFFSAAVYGSVNEQIPILLLGPLMGAGPVAVFLVATRGADLVALILTVVNLVVGPAFAKLYSAQKIPELRRIAVLSARLILVISLPVAIGLIVFRRPILELIFGPEFVAGASALGILCVGQMVNAAAGSVGLLLNMSGHERYNARGYAIGAVVNIVFCVSLIPVWGIEGAALAFAISRIVTNILLSLWALHTLNINATAFGRTLTTKDKLEC